MMNSGTSALLIQLGFVAWTGVLIGLARRIQRASGSVGWAVGRALPLVWTWCALVLLNITFAHLQAYPLTPEVVELIASGAALFVLPLTCLSGRARTWGAVTLVVCMCLLAFVDLPYLRYFGNIVPVSVWQALPQVGQIRASILRLFDLADLSLLLTVVGALLFAARFGETSRTQSPHLPSAPVIHRLIICTCLLGSWPMARNLQRDFTTPDRVDKVFDGQLVLHDRGVLGAHLFDWLRTMREGWLESPFTAKEWRHVEQFFARRTRIPAPHPFAGVAAGSNLILVQVESLQGWVVDAEVNGQEITPFLNRFQQEALYFPSVYDQTDQGRTSDAEFIVLNSLHALDRGAVVFRRPMNHFVALPNVLRHAGYATLSAHAYQPGFWNRAFVHPRYGFERMVFQQELGDGEIIGWGLADAVFLTRLIPILVAQPKPFFAFLITLGVHYPFDDFPPSHKQLQLGALEGTRLGNYLHNAHYLDATLEKFVEDLKSSGLGANTVVAIYGDHDAGLLGDPETLRLAQDWLRPTAGHHSQWNSLLRHPEYGTGIAVQLLDVVPFFVSIPGHQPHGEQRVTGGQIDIAPTLLDVLGIRPPRSFLGCSLLVQSPRVVALSEPRGPVLSQERFIVPKEAYNLQQDICMAFPSLDSMPLASCGELAREVQEELTLSDTVVMHDLARRLSADGSDH